MTSRSQRKGQTLVPPQNCPRHDTQVIDNYRKNKNKQGQAAVEYILLVAFMTLIFGAMFTAIRQNLFNLWVCEIAPRIQSPIPCGNGSDCLGFSSDDATKNFCYR